MSNLKQKQAMPKITREAQAFNHPNQLVNGYLIEVAGEPRFDSAPHKPIIQAESCLVKAQLGDLVLCYMSAKRVYIIAVLESLSEDKELSLEANHIKISAEKLELTGADFSLKGGVLRKHFHKIFSRSKYHERNVEATDKLTAGNQFVRVEGSSLQSSKNLSIIGKAVARIRGGQVHMG